MIGGRRGGGGGAFRLGSMLLLLLGVTWFIPPQVDGIKCYECDGDAKCNGDKLKESIDTCKKDTDVCAVITFEDVGNKKGWVRRRCVRKEEYKEDCGEDVNRDKVKYKYCYCKEDLCNGTLKKYPSSVMIFMVAAVTVVIISGSGHGRI